MSTDIPGIPEPRTARTAPTWEVELLISGVAVFAMLQLPGWLDDRLLALTPRLDWNWQQVVLLTYLYLKSAAVVLAITFALHLGLRATWIALVGMDSVYPGGVRADKLRMGPVQRETETDLAQGSDKVIERADNRASVVFAIGVMVATMIAGIMLAVVLACLVTFIVSKLSGIHADLYLWAMWLVCGLLAPLLIAGLVDHFLGARLTRGGFWHRVLLGVFGAYRRLGLGRSSNWIYSLLASHGGERKALAIQMVLMLAVLSGVGLSVAAMRTPERLGNYAGFPSQRGENRILRAHYDDQRDPAHDDALPYIPSAVADGSYLALTVPYQPSRDEPAMRRTCAHAAAIVDRRQRADARLACLQALHAVTLDGEPVAGLQYEIASDPRAARPALLAMIDIRALPPGRHELHVARPPRADRDKDDKDDPDPGYHRIVFWR